ncbi:MAG: hypothetical protein IH951_03125 [Bacteroidetes bacterium]|nr:hypothetical protein [Bacteroidota bacterium]
MGDTWISDLTHFLDDRGQPTTRPGVRRIGNHLGSIVSGLTANPSEKAREIPVSCRRRPKRQACPGRIHASFEPGTLNILWFCPVCDDQGLICNWHNTVWDKGGRVGLPRIDKVTYTYGFTEDIMEDSRFDTIVLNGSAITHELVRVIHDNQVIGAAGVYGDPTAGDPLQVDRLIIEHGGESTSIVVYNRAIMLFVTNEEFFRQVHRVCCVINRPASRV